jgi:glycerol uptake facilitator protein
MKNSLPVLCFAEFFGTFFFISIGLASVAVLVLGLSDINYPWMAACWGVGVTLAIYVVGGVSGAHMNPAVTLSLAVWGGFDKNKVLPYVACQILGAFCAAALVYTCFHEQILAFEAAKGIVRNSANGAGSAGMYVTAGGGGVSLMTAFLVEVSITCMLLLVIYATTDAKNPAAPGMGLPAIAIGATVLFCGAAFGPLTGFAMNPARDFGPRLFLMLSGWGNTAFGNGFYWLIVPIIATIIGGQLAGWLYTKILCRGIPAHCPPDGTVACEAPEGLSDIA